MKIAFNPSTVAALTTPPNNKDITFDLRGQNIFARGVKFCGTDTNTWRDIKINNVSIGSHTLDLRNGSNTTLTNTNGVVTINSTWRPVVDNLTSNSTTSSLSANQGRVLAGLINGKSDSDHNHDGRYVKKSGDTMLGALNFANGTWNLVGDASYMGDCNVSGHVGIKAANTTYPGIAFFNNASTYLGNLTAYSGNIKYGAYSLQFLDNGNTSVGVSTWINPFSNYNSNAVADGQAICIWGQSSYLGNLSTDTGDMSLWLKRVNAKVATLNMVLDGEYYAGGYQRLAHVSEIPTSLKNPYALTISLNGTSQGPYDGSAAKNINITPGSIGAATSDHNHDDRYLRLTGGTMLLGEGLKFHANDNYFGTNADARIISLLDNNDKICGGGLIIDERATLNGKEYVTELLRIRDSEFKWRGADILHSGNYSGILDSRYYTESEVNSLLDAKLNRQNLSYGTWNPRGYNLAADYFYNEGNLSISENSGKIYVSIDGQFYQNEGQYRVLDTSDVAELKGDLTVHQYLSNTDATWWPLIWGGSSHNNTSNSTGAVYKSHDVLSWQTSSQTLYATNIQTQNIRYLSIGGGIFWNPYVESATDRTDAASITLVKSGVAGGTTLVLSQMDNTNDTIQFETNTAARLYHNSYPILTTQNTYVNNYKGYINGTEITQVNNADTLDGAHLIRYGNGTGIKQVYYFHMQGDNTSYIKLGTLNTVAVTGAGSSKVMFTVKGGIQFGRTNESVYEVAASTRGSIQVTSTLVRGNRELKFGYVSTSSNVEIWMAYDGTYRGVTEVEVSSSVSFTLAMTETTTKPSGFVEGSYRILASTADNVASATKLATARSIWGQSFDGTGNVNGTIYINNSNSSNGAIRLNSDINSNARISAIDDQVIFNTGNAIRFGETAWDWNQWAGLKYTHSNKTIYLGIADGSAFNANSAQSNGTLRLAGISNIDLNSGTSIRGLATNGSPYFSYINLYDTSISLTAYGDISMSTGPGAIKLTAGQGANASIGSDFKIEASRGVYLNQGNSGNVSLCQGGGKVGIGTMSPVQKLDVNGQVRASGFIHSDHSINDAVLLAGGGYERIFKQGTTNYNGTSYALSFHKLSGLCNNLVWVDGHIQNSTSTSFQVSSNFYPYLYANSSSTRTIYRMDGNNMITIDGNGIVVISCSSYPRRVGFFYTGRA